MFQTFTGNSRRARNVNLSGRIPNSNPFAKTPNGVELPIPQNAVATAQQNRVARQQERERTQAAIVLQKTWRGHFERQSFGETLRKRWDILEGTTAVRNRDTMEIDQEMDMDAQAYGSAADCLSQLELLLRFLDLRHEGDFLRLKRFSGRLRRGAEQGGTTYVGGLWPAAYLQLQQACLAALAKGVTDQEQSQLFGYVHFLMERTPSPPFFSYYNTLHRILIRSAQLDLENVVAPFRSRHAFNVTAYEAFAHELMDLPNLKDILGGGRAFDLLASFVNFKLLGSAVAKELRDRQHAGSAWLVAESRVQNRLWLLVHFVYFCRYAHNYGRTEKYASDRDFVFVTGTLLSSLVEQMELEAPLSDVGQEASDFARSRGESPVDTFAREQLLSLVNQASVAGALSLVESPDQAKEQRTSGEETRLLANYILALLRLFPRRGDEIRMWLYLGSSGFSGAEPQARISVIRYFWQAASHTMIYETISHDSRAAIRLLKTHKQAPPSQVTAISAAVPPMEEQADIEDQWRVILIFIELYMFMLKVMDDEEFFSSGKATSSSIDGPSCQKNALLLLEIEGFTLFLKNLGFTMYYNAGEITDFTKIESEADIGRLFRVSKGDITKSTSDQVITKPRPAHVPGVQGMTLDYVKGLVTGLLRAVYERDSRRPFLPKDHWLMTSRFDMTNFIDAVVEEEGRRHKVQEEDDEDQSDNEDEHDVSGDSLVGTGHAQRQRRIEQLGRQQRKASRKRFMQSVAPRLEILQNMPFFIPFTTRVHIFRRFVHLDKLKRLHGHDPFGITDAGRHHAKIRRAHEFEDAYKQFYELGEGLKDPIRITFVDQFDTPEAGIDGGGVTKEFLTSVTNEAFAPSDGINMFAENDQHLLFPNPSAIDEQKEVLREAGLKPTMPEYREQIGNVLKKYEFLGRIIGKCLYEGILVDIGFAGFFLLKWALTGGTGAAPRESGYRANLNDLRDFDESLYQGLLQLKNYPGDVEDFSLNFTATDTISTTKTVTRDLIPTGSTVSVTSANRLVYISYMARHRLSSQPHLQTFAFLQGLAAIIQPSWLSMFNQSELQTLVGGAAAQISVSDLRANTIYGGLYVIGDDGEEHETVKLFWQVMQEDLGEAERRMVLKFVTSTPRAPLLGFASLTPKFSIRDGGTDETRLPSTSTCVNLLKLPRYTRREVLRGKLLQAVQAGAGFDLS